MSPSFVNIAAYKFVTIDDAAALRAPMLEQCQALGLKGTILLTPEGINLFLAGQRVAIDTFLTSLRSDARFADLEVKESLSATQPFNKMLIKLKAEIITMKLPVIRPEQGRAPAVAPRQLKRWLDQGHDDHGKPVVMLDTRNAFEVEVGSFDGTLTLPLDKFSDFPAAVAARRDDFIGKTVVTFCTGGIRCEKAAIHMRDIGIDNVLQLDGGILKYFDEVGGEHYHGACFVFDQRTALDAQLQASADVPCARCAALISPRAQLGESFARAGICTLCAEA